MSGNSLGAEKAAARRRGMTVAQYRERLANGEKWCSGCKAWHSIGEFRADINRRSGISSVCVTHRQRIHKAVYVPKVGPRRFGPLPYAPRPGDQVQARQRVNVEVRTGRRTHPNLLPCADCGHDWAAGERRHEYDHYLGYDAAHHYDVEAVCTICHHARENRRRAQGEMPAQRAA